MTHTVRVFAEYEHTRKAVSTKAILVYITCLYSVKILTV